MNGQTPGAMKPLYAGEVVVAESLRLAMKLLYERQDASDELLRRTSERHTADVTLLRQQYQQLARQHTTDLASWSQQHRQLEEATTRRGEDLRNLIDAIIETTRERQHRSSSRHGSSGLAASTITHRHANNSPGGTTAAAVHRPATSGPLFPRASHRPSSVLEQSLDVPRPVSYTHLTLPTIYSV